MAYEPDGLRIKLEESTGTKKFVWDDQNYLAETDENDDAQVVYTNEPRLYGNLVSQRRLTSGTWTPHWYCFDAIGSTRELTDASEAVTDTRLYDAWGSTVAQAGSNTFPFGFIGCSGYHVDGDCNHLYVRSRSYVPAAGRWLSLDALLFTFLMNRYVYAQNSPITFIDSSGKQAGLPELPDVPPPPPAAEKMRCPPKNYCPDRDYCTCCEDVLAELLDLPRIKKQFDAVKCQLSIDCTTPCGKKIGGSM